MSNKDTLSVYPSPSLIADTYTPVGGSHDSVRASLTLNDDEEVDAILELRSNDKGFLLPRVSKKVIEESNVVDGMVFYNSTDNAFNFRADGAYVTIGTGTGDVFGPNVSAIGNIPTFSNTTGKVLQDSGVNISRVPPVLLTGRPAPLADNVNEIGNIGHIHFEGSDGVGIIFVDSLAGAQYIENDLGTFPPESQICTLITGGLPSASTTPSALLELQSSTGALLISRMTTAEIGDLNAVNGMLVYDTDTNHFLMFQDGAWTIIDDGGPSDGTVTSVAAGIGLTGGPITTTGTISIANTTVTAGSYSYPTLSVNAQGQLTACSSNSPVTSVIGTANQVLANGTSGSAETGAITLTLPQDISTTSSPAFQGLDILNNSGSFSVGNHLVIGDIAGASNEKYWNFTTNGETLYGISANDALNVGESWIQVVRSGDTIDSVSFPNGVVNVESLSTSTLVATDGSKNLVSASGSYSINAATATALQTARNINGVSFDGTADITVTAAAGTLTGNTLNSTVTSSSLTSVGTVSSGTWSASFGSVSGANLTNLTAANISAGTAGINISGNAATVTNGVYTTDAGTVTNTMLAGSIEFSKLIGSDIVIAESQVTNLTTDLASKLNLSGGTMTGNLILNGDPSSSLMAATKNYVDSLAAGMNIFVAVAASTANLSATYSNGSSGVGATLTMTSTGAFSLDGQAGVLNALYLIKDQSSTFQNGIYQLTTVGNVSTASVLTRASYYNTPTEITAGDIVNIALGTTNGGISYMETATITTVGTDPITYARWGGQSMTFTGNVSGSGFSPVTLSIGTGVVTNAMLAGSISDSKLLTISSSGKVSNSATTATSNNTASTIVARDASGNFIAGTITADLIGNATTATLATSATNATNTGITDDTTTNATMYLTWVTAITGNLPQKTSSSKLTFNPSTGTLTATAFSGAFSGTSTNADNIKTTIDDASSSAFRIPFAPLTATAYQALSVNDGITYYPNTRKLVQSGNSSSGATGYEIHSNNTASITLDRGGVGSALISYQTSATDKWRIGLRTSGNDKYDIYDAVNSAVVMSFTNGSPPKVNLPTLSSSTLLALDGSNNISNASGTYGISISGNSATATIVDDTTTNATMYPVWVTTNTGGLPLKVSSTKMSFNPSTATLTTTTFSGALSGNSTTATTLQNARTIGGVSFNGSANIVPQTIETASESSDATCFPLFVTATGTQQLQPKNNSSFTFDPTVCKLGVTSLLTTNLICDAVNNQQLEITSGWTDTGSGVIITGTSVNPSYTTTQSKVYVKRIGDTVMVKYEFERATGTTGTGDYLIALPSGYAFSPMVPLYSGSGSNVASAPMMTSLVGFGHISNGSSKGKCSAFAYDATHFRIAGENAFTNYQMYGATYYQLNSTSAFSMILIYPASGDSGVTTLTETQRFSAFSNA